MVSDSGKEILKSLGFKSYKDYLNSELWKIIKEVVLARDVHHCRCCGATGDNVFRYTDSKAAFLGAQPELLITVCNQCLRDIYYEGRRKRSLRGSQKFMLEQVTRTKIVKGVSNPRVGYWFKRQAEANVETRETIRAKIKEQCNV
jgi:hypothetical protein